MQHLLCFSHLSWNFVFQRPQHLLTRFAKIYQVLYFEEPKIGESHHYTVDFQDGVYIVQLFVTRHDEETNAEIAKLIKSVIKEYEIQSYISWYYTPMALDFTYELSPELVIYDSMDELSAFKFAPPRLLALEDELFQMADIVFTGGQTLYQAKKHRHHNIHAFPSSIDKDHFGAARLFQDSPKDQEHIPYPRLGFFGVVDERFDVQLLRDVAGERPNWNFIIIGPVVKISHEDLPQAPNIHYLGSKQYSELPAYISQWDISLIMFALNESTKFISPTKTPEYLAAGKPVISTPITDVVEPYGSKGLVHIVDDCTSFVLAAEEILKENNREEWLSNVDNFLKDNSWDHTFSKMNNLISELYAK
ncbi:hypothetical protein ASG01_02675 [Chryseobacterium sp. Leaf180]|uniref:glycosyltransferase n=1 Tax=Chryseobacterium sp. Leaf180 TaxID=1736289 RepID=UPI0006FBED96|nr:glycosyltransferase [Chryseobacterium sp. Leaf180]KQR94791.1 hypothetical protein ASG01_02675 [Chryseobacterium sp. Leaf180]